MSSVPTPEASIAAVHSVPPPPTFDPLQLDPATQSNPSSIYTTHIHLEWNVDWNQRIIRGSATHSMAVLKPTDLASFDTKFLVVKKVDVGGEEVKWELGEEDEVMGRRLDVILGEKAEKGDKRVVKIEYETTEKCTALGWMDAEQTASGTTPFLYSQCQAIHARSLLPCQDTPSVKITYSASVTSPYQVLLSARPLSPPSLTPSTDKQDKTYEFDQPVAIPSYLIAIAGGALAFRKIGERTGVWADPTMVDDAAWEFADEEKFVAKAEEIAGEYVWGRYDCLILPKSFPFGGMENSNLTFVTPTLLAGDKSLVDVVAHEISHSWFGNLVSCSSWVHFWLNEGWTTYLERLVLRSLHGEPSRSLQYLIGRIDLREALAGFPDQGKQSKYRRLVIDFERGEDPDDAFSTVPYEKGSNLLLWLERWVERESRGKETWWKYIKAYVDKFKGRSIGTEEWRNHLREFMSQEEGEEWTKIFWEAVKWDKWLNGQDLDLPEEMTYDTTLADQAWKLADRWTEAAKKDPEEKKPDAGKLGFSKEDLEGFECFQTVLLIDRLTSLSSDSSLPPAYIHLLGTLYSLSSSPNAEVRLSFYKLSLRSESGTGKDYFDEAAEWVADKGRMKYCRPVYRLLRGVDEEKTRESYKKGRGFYHPIARAMLDKDLGVKE